MFRPPDGFHAVGPVSEPTVLLEAEFRRDSVSWILPRGCSRSWKFSARGLGRLGWQIGQISFGTKTTRQPKRCRRTRRERHMRRAEQSVALLAEGLLASAFAGLDQIQIALNLDRYNYGFVIQRSKIRIRRGQH
jgi:hypothetical protein